MSSTVTIPVTLRPSRIQSALLLLLSSVFVAGGVLMIRDGEVMGYFCGGFFALCLSVFALQFHPRAAYLRLEEDGFTYCALFRPHTVQWAHVEEFGVIRVTVTRLVAWNFVPSHSLTGSARRMSRSTYGFEASLPDTYGMKPQELADLLNNLRLRHRRVVDARDGLGVAL